MDTEISAVNLKRLLRLLREYNEKAHEFTPLEYLDNILAENENYAPDIVLEMFLKLKRHEKIFQCLLEEYSTMYITRQFKLTARDKLILVILFDLFICELTDSNYQNIKNICVKFKPTMFLNFMEFINREEFLILTTETTCSIFGSEYTLEKIIRPLVQKMNLIEKLQKYCIQYFEEKERLKCAPKPVTIPKSPRITKPTATVAAPAEPVPLEVTFTHRSVPATTYEGDTSVQQRLQEEHDKNRAAAMKLLELARTNAFSCAKPQERKEVKVEEIPKIIKAKKIPKVKPVNVKGNATMLMREAHRMTKTCEEEVKKLETMISNATNPSIYENWEEEERKKLEQEHLQNIQKKHLQGLLTREEAIIAKQNLLKLNKEKMLETKAEKIKLNADLEEWRENERLKIKELVEKSQNIQQAAKYAEKKVFDDKQRAARMVDEETRYLLNQAMEEKEAELARKIELIKDVKALQALKYLHVKEFDPTESANLGLMCEMSIAELQERLFCLKLEIEEEQEKKRKAISDLRKQRRDMLDNAREFIEQNKCLKEKSKKPKKVIKVMDTPEIIALKNRIDEARKQRVNNEIELQY